jgi:hypothetical protein
MMDQLARQEGAVRTVYHDQPNPAFQVCFALGLNAPRVPTRFFATMEEDLAWVKMTARGR